MTRTLLKQVQQAGEDFEWYPTTDEIIRVLVKDIERMHDSYDDTTNRRIEARSVLDIGAGNGKVLRAFQNKELYAIEKSQTLCAVLAPIAFIVGTDFWQQSLLTKNIDVTFSNPPYSQFDPWATKIIKESSSALVYLVLPSRWQRSDAIAAALKYRQAKHKVIGSFDFEDAEDRKARAKVDLIRIQMVSDRDDAFDRFFDEQFANLNKRFDATKPKDEEPGREQKNQFTHLVSAKNYIEAIVEMYDQEILKIKHHYDAIATLDANLLREFNVQPKDILKCLKERLSSLKQVYWRELFSRMRPITDRLTSKKRQLMLNKLNENGHVDFTIENIQAIVIWVLANASRYIDEQVLDVFDEILSKANVRNYKSNQKPFVYDRWRYEQAKPTHIALEYRLVLERSGGITIHWGHRELSEHAATLLRDLCAIANNLNFHTDSSDRRLFALREWEPGRAEEFYFTRDGQEDVLFEVRAFKNGNMHVRLNQQFALAFNVEHGRLRGWIHSPEEAVNELNDMMAAAYFNTQIRLDMTSLPMLAARGDTRE